jgi:hypothetical protein
MFTVLHIFCIFLIYSEKYVKGNVISYKWARLETKCEVGGRFEKELQHYHYVVLQVHLHVEAGGWL